MTRDTRESGGRTAPGGVALALVAVGLAVWVVSNSALFATREIRVRGNVHLTADDVRRLAGLAKGDNVLRLSTDLAARSVERSPWVAGVEVSRSLPDVVTIRVRERTAAAWVRDPEGPVTLAEDGTVLGRRGHVRGLPLVGRWPSLLGPGDEIPMAPAPLRAAATLPPELRVRVARVALRRGGLVVELRSGETAIYGDATGLGAKHEALASLLRWTRRQGIGARYLDVSIPRSPVLRPA